MNEKEMRAAVQGIENKAMRTAVRAITSAVTDRENALYNAFEALQRAKTPRWEMLDALGYSPFWRKGRPPGRTWLLTLPMRHGRSQQGSDTRTRQTSGS